MAGQSRALQGSRFCADFVANSWLYHELSFVKVVQPNRLFLPIGCRSLPYGSLNTFGPCMCVRFIELKTLLTSVVLQKNIPI